MGYVDVALVKYYLQSLNKYMLLININTIHSTCEVITIKRKSELHFIQNMLDRIYAEKQDRYEK